jgi:hypothetical protein
MREQFVLVRCHNPMPAGQGFRSCLTSDNSNREVNPVNASTPNVCFEMEKIVQQPATAVNTSNDEVKAFT